VLAGTAGSGLCTAPTHAYAAYGVYTVTVVVTDKDGASTVATTTHEVNLAFAGFFRPVSNLPAVNVVKAGRSIPFTFSLGRRLGTNPVTAATSTPVACTVSATNSVSDDDDEDDREERDSDDDRDGDDDRERDGRGRYTYVWKTQRSWAGQCRLFTLTTVDGEEHQALFRFRR